MNFQFCRNAFLCIAVVALSLAGCGDNSTQEPSTSDSAQTSESPSTVDDHEHAHPSEGPHGGSLIELGEEAYHAELVHDEATETVTIYVLDSAAKNSVAIDAADVTINVTHEGRGEQFKLTASPDRSDPPGKASRFTSADAKLAEELDHEHVEAQLVLTIDGAQYRGAIEHEHGHEDDEHGPAR